MDSNFALKLVQAQLEETNEKLMMCNEYTIKFGLALTPGQIKNLMQSRFNSLKDTGRVEFNEGVLEKLIFAFCDSPYIFQENYEETLAALQDCFYYFKNESHDLMSDDEIIENMKAAFDGPAEGSVEYLTDITLDDLYHKGKY